MPSERSFYHGDSRREIARLTRVTGSQEWQCRQIWPDVVSFEPTTYEDAHEQYERVIAPYIAECKKQNDQIGERIRREMNLIPTEVTR